MERGFCRCAVFHATMLVAGILVIAAQCVCAAKTYQFTNADYYDQQSGERL